MRVRTLGPRVCGGRYPGALLLFLGTRVSTDHVVGRYIRRRLRPGKESHWLHYRIDSGRVGLRPDVYGLVYPACSRLRHEDAGRSPRPDGVTESAAPHLSRLPLIFFCLSRFLSSRLLRLLVVVRVGNPRGSSAHRRCQY